jgi:hypothetical protein
VNTKAKLHDNANRALGIWKEREIEDFGLPGCDAVQSNVFRRFRRPCYPVFIGLENFISREKKNLTNALKTKTRFVYPRSCRFIFNSLKPKIHRNI